MLREWTEGRPRLLNRENNRYLACLAALLVSLGLVLLTGLDMRRGILLAMAAYSKLGSPSAVLHFHPLHLPLLFVGMLGAFVAYRWLARREVDLRARGHDLRWARNVFGLALMGLLVADLFTYRIVQARRIFDAGRLGLSFSIPVQDAPVWLRPVAEALNYLLSVWHATILGILIGSLLLVLLVSSGLLRSAMRRTGLGAHVFSSFAAVSYPFCSCCASPIAATMYRGGASLESVLAFTVAAPMLNVTSLTLAVALLPADLALLRIGAGMALAIFGTYLVSRSVMGQRVQPQGIWNSPLERGLLRALDAFASLFAFERRLQGRAIESPAALVAAWLGTSWRVGRIAVPTVFAAAIVASLVAPRLLSLADANDLATVAVTALLGTVLMVPTWGELAMAAPLAQQGLAAPAAALLLTLPAVSLPCLVVIGAAVGSMRVPLLLGGVVFLAGLLAGAVFIAL
jgi:uncharacterized membrane protein YraQ (UPF0718 family)